MTPNVTFVWGNVQYDETSTKSLHAVINGNIIGFIDVYPLPTGEYGIGQVTVWTYYRRKGIATALFNEAKKTLPTLIPYSYDYSDAGAKWIQSLLATT